MSLAMSYPALGIAWGVLKYVIGVPLVNKALDNWFHGTSNKIDDLVWNWLEKMAGVPEAERPTVIASSLWDLQRTYNAAKADGTLENMKLSEKRWDVAMVVPKVFPSSNVG